jgi:hypothetical protein
VATAAPETAVAEPAVEWRSFPPGKTSNRSTRSRYEKLMMNFPERGSSAVLVSW